MTANITYVKRSMRRHDVYLDSTKVGQIIAEPGGYRYHPKGGNPGDLFRLFSECQHSLESDAD